MITTVDGKRVLEIFERFVNDTSLPKFKPETKKVTEHDQVEQYVDSINDHTALLVQEPNFTAAGSGTFMSGSLITSSGSSTQVMNSPNFWSGENVVQNINASKLPKKPIFVRFVNAIKQKFKKKEVVVPVQETFKLIFETMGQINAYKERELYIEVCMDEAKKAGQVALLEKLVESRTINRLESQLLALGYDKLITEEQLVQFADVCEKGLKLDWVKNFIRRIPTDVLEKKLRADTIKLFDNYVVLHFDPKGKSSSLTKEEIEKKKDPILFGVFNNSRKLYFIGDWKDEVCDLTFDQLIDKIGKDALQIKKDKLHL